MPPAVSPVNHPHHDRRGGGSSPVGQYDPATAPLRHSASNGSASSARHTYTHLTYSRHHLVDTAKETIRIAEDGRYTNRRGDVVDVKADLDHSVEHSAHYEDEFDFRAALRAHDAESRSMRGLDENSADDGDGLDGSGGSRGSAGGRRGRRAAPPSTSSFASPRISGPLLDASPLRLSLRAPLGDGRRFPRTSFLVVSASWLESASELLRANASNDAVPSRSPGGAARTRVGVLNSASGTTPGGRFLKGTVSQEDCLCRASLLYACISQPKFQSEGRFYGRNRGLRYGTSNCVIFSPDVPVIREDNVEGKLLDDYEKVSFVTIPAPNAFTTSSNTGREYNDIEAPEREKRLDGHSRKPSEMDLSASVSGRCPESPAGGLEPDADERLERKRRALLASLSDRIRRALSAFALGDCTDLVLPAFGCGVHGNDPSMVAGVFREMLADPAEFGGRFRTVVFAIPPSRKQNYVAFAAYFQGKKALEGSAQAG